LTSFRKKSNGVLSKVTFVLFEPFSQSLGVLVAGDSAVGKNDFTPVSGAIEGCGLDFAVYYWKSTPLIRGVAFSLFNLLSRNKTETGEDVDTS